LNIAVQKTYDPMLTRSPLAPRNVLVVDDSRAQRKILTASLMRRGYHVMEAGSGEDALALCRLHRFDFVLSDWMMPGMSGLEFCAAFRALPRDGYGYFILLTSRSEKGEAARGLDAGADDFLAKPVDSEELHARITAGERILRMERELTQKNHVIGATLAEMRMLYDSLDRDLIEARKLQQSLVPVRHHDFGRAKVSLLLQPSGHVGGDLVGVFPINDRRIGLFAIDVSGHGVASAIMTARLAGVLSGAAPEQNIALVTGPGGQRDGRPPEQVAQALNRLLLDDIQTEQYLTLLYADVDLLTGETALVQAGHPHPAVQRANGTVEFIGAGGLPVGLIAGARYDRVTLSLAPGDRLLLMSDGITECVDAVGNQLGEAGLADLATANAALGGMTFLNSIVRGLHVFAGAPDFADDISAVLLELAPISG
jgi:sigma-B regulation protein RsbU (phosphoserine phosphatase)